MPKKFQGENSKAAQAKARKEGARRDEQDKRAQEAEDALWVDDDKHQKKKDSRKDEKERKRLEQLERKHANKELLESEQSQVKGAGPGAAGAGAAGGAKVTRAEIEGTQAAARAHASKRKGVEEQDDLLVENVNRMDVGDEARNVDDAIRMLKDKDDLEKHPERRQKAAYASFEARRLEELKSEKPNLRLSQLKQILRKEWKIAPENPTNSEYNVAYNTKV